LIKQLHLDFSLRDDATFINYVGEAAEILMQKNQWLYVWGKPGTGRSHLLQAVCHYKKNSIYLTSLKQHQSEILKGLESVDVICIDDIQEILEDSVWEEALFHLMNAVVDSGKQIILAGNKPASQLKVKLADLHSRLIAATAVETDNLSDSQKLVVLTNRAEAQGYRLSPEVGSFILSRSHRDMRKLMEILGSLEKETLSQGKIVTIPFVKQILKL